MTKKSLNFVVLFVASFTATALAIVLAEPLAEEAWANTPPGADPVVVAGLRFLDPIFGL